MGKDLREYLEQVRKAAPEADAYVEAGRRLSPMLEISVIQQKLAVKGRFPVLFCPEIEGSRLPLVTNLLGSYDCWIRAFGIEQETLAVGKAAILNEYRRRLQTPRPVKYVPRAEAPVKEVVLKGDAIDLGLLPIPHHSPLDSGKYVLMGCTICRSPDTGVLNLGVYRHELKGKDSLSCAIIPSNHGAYIARRYAELGRPMEVAVFIGHHPLVHLGSQSRGDMNRNELEVTGGLLGEPLEMTEAETVDLPVPSRAEIVLEGIIDTSQKVTDGPIAEYTGYYGNGGNPCYLVQLKAITMRHDAIYHDLDPAHREATLVSLLALELNALEAVKKVVPSVRAVHILPSTANFRAIVISIAKRIPGEAKLAGQTALADPLIEVAVVVDEDIDVYNEQEVMWAVGTRVSAERDLYPIPQMLAVHLEPTAYDETRLRHGTMISKMVIDATRPVDLPFARRTKPPRHLWESMRLEDYLK